MENHFILSIDYKNDKRDYAARLLPQGYSYKIIVSIDDLEIYFEPDEERNFRVVSMPGQDEKKLDKIDKNLLQALTQKIEEIIQ